MKLRSILYAAIAALLSAHVADAQVANGKVTTAAPTYTTGNIAPLSLDTSGSLRTTSTNASGILASGQATTAAPSYTNNTPNPLSLDLAGNLRSSILTALPAGTNVIGVVGNTQGSTTSGQSGPLAQGAVTTAAPAYTNAQTSPLSLTTGGNLRTVDLATVAQGSTTAGQSGGLEQGAVTTAAPSYTNAQTSPLSLTTAGNLRTVDLSSVAQGSTTSGQSGGLIQGAVTTNAPSYTTGQTSPISLDTAGNQRIVISPVAQTGGNALASTTVTVIKASAGTLYGYTVTACSTNNFFQIYDNASACTGTIRAQAACSTTAGYGVTLSPPITMSNGISVCVSAGTANATVQYQ